MNGGANLLHHVHGAVALVLFCTLIFVEEAGVPLPLLPGDGLLIAGGVLVANHSMAPLLFYPAVTAAAIAGALVGYRWSHAVGQRGLDTLGRRLNAGEIIGRAASRLRSAGSGGIVLCRLLPGLRVYSSLVAGATSMRFQTFLAGLVPAVIIWVGVFVTLGVIVGVPAEHFLQHAQRVILNAAVMTGVALTAYVGLRHIPVGGRSDRDVLPGARRRRIVAALVIDAVVVASIAVGLTELLDYVFDVGTPDGLGDAGLVLTGTLLVYVTVSRRSVGVTAGEGVLNVSYRGGRGRSR